MGSEMCIRDRYIPLFGLVPVLGFARSQVSSDKLSGTPELNDFLVALGTNFGIRRNFSRGFDFEYTGQRDSLLFDGSLGYLLRS